MRTVRAFVTDLDTWPILWLPAVLDQRAVSGRAPSGRPTARGWGCTGQGLSVLHETPTFVEYTRMPASGTPPSCSSRPERAPAGSDPLIEHHQEPEGCRGVRICHKDPERECADDKKRPPGRAAAGAQYVRVRADRVADAHRAVESLSVAGKRVVLVP